MTRLLFAAALALTLSACCMTETCDESDLACYCELNPENCRDSPEARAFAGPDSDAQAYARPAER